MKETLLISIHTKYKIKFKKKKKKRIDKITKTTATPQNKKH